MTVPTDPAEIPATLTKLGENLGPWVSVGFGAIMVLWGGAASFVQRIRVMKEPFRLSSFVGDLTISGFSGISVGLLFNAYEVNPKVTLFAIGIGAHMGARAIGLFEHWYIERAKRMLGVDKEPSLIITTERPNPPPVPAPRDISP